MPYIFTTEWKEHMFCSDYDVLEIFTILIFQDYGYKYATMIDWRQLEKIVTEKMISKTHTVSPYFRKFMIFNNIFDFSSTWLFITPAHNFHSVYWGNKVIYTHISMKCNSDLFLTYYWFGCTIRNFYATVMFYIQSNRAGYFGQTFKQLFKSYISLLSKQKLLKPSISIHIRSERL